MRDSEFIRGEIPMTKSEVRAVSLAKMELVRDSVIYDIGAGTGSVSVEAALLARDGHVYAFEQKEEGCCLIRANAEKHHADHITVIRGKAPDSFAGYPSPDRVFIGGSNGQLGRILNHLFKMNPKVRIVINVIALETLNQVMEYCREHDLENEIVQVAISRAELRAGYHMMQGQNPVYVITLNRKWENESTKEPEENHENQLSLPRILVAAPSSGSGKTVITTGLLALLKRRGHHPISFKCGPDYIDPMFHRYVLGIPGCNLDSFFLEERELQHLFGDRAQQTDLAVIEGVMGYYDGIAGNSLHASTYEIACMTDTPVILVLDGKKSSLSLAAQLKGFMTYQKNSHIAGVILNRTSPVMLERLKTELEKLGAVCLGAVPECEEARLESRHLGLTIPQEQTMLRERIELLADRLASCLDLEKIEKIAGGASLLEMQEPAENKKASVSRRMAVAQDEAFCFYYQENLDFLKTSGWELIPFSPIHDSCLPENIDGILLGGGYPEVYAKQLSENKSMLEKVRHAAENRVKLLAECGGFLYLHESLEGADGEIYPMAGVIPAKGYRTECLSRFGYMTLKSEAGDVKAHEFHYWDSTAPGSSMTAQKPGSDRSWSCMYETDTMMAGFPHLYYLSAPERIRTFLDKGASR